MPANILRSAFFRYSYIIPEPSRSFKRRRYRKKYRQTGSGGAEASGAGPAGRGFPRVLFSPVSAENFLILPQFAIIIKRYNEAAEKPRRAGYITR
jgi:hypothetical protein